VVYRVPAITNPESGGAGPDRETDQHPTARLFHCVGGVLSPLLANVLLDEWIRSWRSAGTHSAATPTTATCTCGRGARVNA